MALENSSRRQSVHLEEGVGNGQKKETREMMIFVGEGEVRERDEGREK